MVTVTKSQPHLDYFQNTHSKMALDSHNKLVTMCFRPDCVIFVMDLCCTLVDLFSLRLLRGLKAWVRFSRAHTDIPWARPVWFCGMRNYHMT